MELVEHPPTREEIEQALADPEPAQELSLLTPEERAIGAKILPVLAARIRQEAQAEAKAEAAKELARQTQELIAQNTRMIEDEVKKLREQMQPPDPKQLEELISQEYGEMTVKVFPRKGSDGQRERDFILRELPQAAEKKMLGMLSKKIVPHLRELASVEWSAASTQAEKMQKVIELIPDGLDVLAACCAICFDPFGDDGISTEWIQNNMGSSRIMNAIEAQLAISKIRDFGSAVYRLLPR